MRIRDTSMAFLSEGLPVRYSTSFDLLQNIRLSSPLFPSLLTFSSTLFSPPLDSYHDLRLISFSDIN